MIDKYGKLIIKLKHPYIENVTPNYKQMIIDLFNSNIKGLKPPDKPKGYKHDGYEGHWLEDKMGIKHNSNNLPDLYGYEMKKESNCITFGDFTADEYIYKTHPSLISSRDDFIRSFGTCKGTRFSWSGSCIPSYDVYNDCGQILRIDIDNHVIISYNYKYDKRQSKVEQIKDMNDVNIVVWTSLKMKIENKFGQRGFFICRKNRKGFYSDIIFGSPFSYSLFLEGIRSGDIYFDSGMHTGNYRNYSQWRAGKSFWINLTSTCTIQQ